ncbi:MAG: cysteine hydrolase [Clostridia bacterium]|nr:cysteine hydrolase [Clostridia bacterium]
MQKILIVVDMQNDFIDGALGTPEAVAILPKVKNKIETFDGKVIFTRDTHTDDYMNTAEGKNLPVPHCIKDTHGWQIADALLPYTKDAIIIDKPTFGSIALAELLQKEDQNEAIDEVTLIGLCTDICVISNAMLAKAALPEITVSVDASCCAGVTPESHDRALAAMQVCQIKIL